MVGGTDGRKKEEERAAALPAPLPMMIIDVLHHSVASAARDGIPCLVESLFQHKDFFNFRYNYPALRAPLLGKKGNYRAIFLKVEEE